MNKIESSESPLSELALAGDLEAATATPLVPIIPLLRPASGLYASISILQLPNPIPTPVVPHLPFPVPQVPGSLPAPSPVPDGLPATPASLVLILRRTELRLDVDGLYPQNTASGTLYGPAAPILHWIASLTRTAANTWTGHIWYKDGNTAGFPYTQVTINVARGLMPTSATVTYIGAGGGAPFAQTLAYKSPYFHPLNLEFDCAQGTTPVLDYQTYSHPNHPATLPNETLTIQTVYRRAGFDVTTNSAAGSIVPLARAGPDSRWSDQEMHDAMQVYWSRFANAPQWANWTFFASLSDMGTGLGGIMFDDVGPAQRQGSAIFVDAFIANPPANDPAPTAWVRRMRFWTAVHEMGHTLNLAHSWDKGQPVSWIPLVPDAEARSFMNYPYRVRGGQAPFFANFAYRFSDQELLFLRHAPERFVEPGNAAWFDHHGFQRDRVAVDSTFTLELRPPRPGATFEFLEPVVLDLKLTNVGDEPQLVDEKVLADAEGMTVIIKKKGKAARQYVPFAQRCYLPKAKVLAPNQSLTDSLFVAVGRNGWDIAEPGEYRVQVMLHLEHEDVLSAPLILRIQRPKSYEEENLASDFFSDDVGRVLAFDGSRALTHACDTLAEAAEMLKTRRVAVHAHVALGVVKARSSKLLDLRDVEPGAFKSAAAAGAKLQVAPADEKEAREHLEVLTKQANVADQTLGRTDYAYYLLQHGDLLGTRTTQARILELVPEAAAEVPESILSRSRASLGRHGRSARALVRDGK